MFIFPFYLSPYIYILIILLRLEKMLWKFPLQYLFTPSTNTDFLEDTRFLVMSTAKLWVTGVLGEFCYPRTCPLIFQGGSGTFVKTFMCISIPCNPPAQQSRESTVIKTDRKIVQGHTALSEEAMIWTLVAWLQRPGAYPLCLSCLSNSTKE